MKHMSSYPPSSPELSASEESDENDVHCILNKKSFKWKEKLSPKRQNTERVKNIILFPNENTSTTTNNMDSNIATMPIKQTAMQKIIIHLDVDCFYCQCEANSDESGTLASQPFAIGQKHIVVTCNYEARALGIKKLMYKTEALKICPNLIIIDGSDLTRYRTQSRNVYMAFRNAVKTILPSGEKNHACKGSMDEMFADITASVSAPNSILLNPNAHKDAFVYGNQSSSTTISEDQSGAKATISLTKGATHDIDDVMDQFYSSSASYFRSDLWGDRKDRQICVQRLNLATHYAHTIQKHVFEQTSFTTCIGISISPMLAKITSDLKKPNSINVLYPWRSRTILQSMPLRRIPQLGSRTLKILNQCLEEESLSTQRNIKSQWWTCRDLLQVPKHKIVACLKKSKSFGINCVQHADFLLQRCRGIDNDSIIDDGGRVTKTVSVENSYIRGSITTRVQIIQALEPLFYRLPNLLEERKSNSRMPSMAYPTTIRLCMCNLIQENRDCTSDSHHNCDHTSINSSTSSSLKSVRRLTTNRQQKFNHGPILLEESKDENKKAHILRTAIIPLIDAILKDPKNNLHTFGINITRINIAVTNFADSNDNIQDNTCASKGMKSISSHFAAHNKKSTTSEPKLTLAPKNKFKRLSQKYGEKSIPDGIDPNVLAELPQDIVEEIIRNKNEYSTPRIGSSTNVKRQKTIGLEAFFCLQEKKEKNS